MSLDLIRHFWENLTNPLIAPLNAMVMQMASGLIRWLHANMRTVLIISTSVGFVGALLRNEDFFLSMVRRLTPLVITVTSLLAVPIYQNVFVNLAMHLPASLIAATTGTPAEANVFAAIDTAQLKSIIGPTTFLEHMTISVWTPTSFVVALMVAAELIATVVAYGVMATCEVMLMLAQGLTLAIGPIALAFFGWERTRNISFAWVSVLMTTIASQVMLGMVITFIIGVEDKLAFNLLTMPQSGQGAFGIAIATLAIAIGVYLLLPLLALFVVPLSRAIFSGVTGAIGPIISGASNAARQTASQVAGGVAGAAGSVAGAAGSLMGARSGGGGSSSSAAAVAPPGRPLGRP